MTQDERRIFLIKELLNESSEYSAAKIPEDVSEQRRLLRSLMNIRRPAPISERFMAVQDEYLRGETAEKGITDAETLIPVRGNICLWQGDITTLKCGAIVNAANSALLGCFCPCHGCIDNMIHTYAGVQLRLECAEIMRKQDHEEETGGAKITSAYNLPCDYILHTVGPIVSGVLTEEHKRLLASCYRSCLELAVNNGIKSVAFCCISTGVFRFPNQTAAEIAVQTVNDFINEIKSEIRVIFNVYKDEDYEIYKQILGADQTFKERDQ